MEIHSSKQRMPAILFYALCLLVSGVSAVGSLMCKVSNDSNLSEQQIKNMIAYASDSKTGVLLFSTPKIYCETVSLLKVQTIKYFENKRLNISKDNELAKILISCGFVGSFCDNFRVAPESDANTCLKKLRNREIISQLDELIGGNIALVLMEDKTHIPSTLPEVSDIAEFNIVEEIKEDESAISTKTCGQNKSKEGLQDSSNKESQILFQNAEEKLAKANVEFTLSQLKEAKLRNKLTILEQSIKNFSEVRKVVLNKMKATNNRNEAEIALNNAKTSYDTHRTAQQAARKADKVKSGTTKLADEFKKAKKEFTKAEEELRKAEEEYYNCLKTPYQQIQAKLWSAFSCKSDVALKELSYKNASKNHWNARLNTIKAKIRLDKAKVEARDPQANNQAEINLEEAKKVFEKSMKIEEMAHSKVCETMNLYSEARESLISAVKNDFTRKEQTVKMIEEQYTESKKILEEYKDIFLFEGNDTKKLRAEIEEKMPGARNEEFFDINAYRLEVDRARLPQDDKFLTGLQEDMCGFELEIKRTESTLNMKKTELLILETALNFLKAEDGDEILKQFDNLTALYDQQFTSWLNEHLRILN